MKFRKIELLERPVMDEVNGKEIQIGIFSYRAILREILMTGPAPEPARGFAGGLTTDEIAQSIMTYGRVKDAVAKNEKFVLLDKECYDYLMRRLATFRWQSANETTHEFCRYIKAVPEEEFEVTRKPDPVPAPAPTAAAN
jgi:hypothetical protein